MPYIKKEIRELIDKPLDNLVRVVQNNFGEDEVEGAANYIISRLLCNMMKPEGSLWRYKYINRVSGVLAQVQSEFNRRIKDPYEDQCINNNGDLKEFSLENIVPKPKI